jgi:hypothetical protein
MLKNNEHKENKSTKCREHKHCFKEDSVQNIEKINDGNKCSHNKFDDCCIQGIFFPVPNSSSSSSPLEVLNVYNSSGQNITPGIPTVVIFDMKLFDTNNSFKTTTSRFQPTVAGFYDVSTTIGFEIASSNISFVLFFRKNGTQNIAQNTVNYNVALPGHLTPGTVSLTSLVQMNGTSDYLEIIISIPPVLTLIISGQQNTYFVASQKNFLIK